MSSAAGMPLAAHVGDGQAEARLRDGDEVVVVAADLIVRDGRAREVEARDARGRRRQERALDVARDGQLLLEPPALDSIPGRACALHRHGRLRGERGQQFQVPLVVGILVVALQVEHADDAALHDERSGDLAARGNARRDVTAVGVHVGHDDWLAALRDPAHDALADL